MSKRLLLIMLFSCIGIQSTFAMQNNDQETVLSEQELQDLKSLRIYSLRQLEKAEKMSNDLDQARTRVSTLYLYNILSESTEELCGKNISKLETQGKYDRSKYPKCSDAIKIIGDTIRNMNRNH